MKRVMGAVAFVLVLAAAGVLWAQEAAAPASTTKSPGIVGIWKLNGDLSDTGDRAAEGGRGEGGYPGGGMPGGFGGRGGMGGGSRGGGGMGGFGGRQQPDREESQRLRRIIQDTTTPPQSLTIVQDGSHVSITAGDGRAFTYVADGKKQEQLTGDGVLEHKTKWDGAQLIIETKIQDGPKVTRTFAPSADTQLFVTVRIEGGWARDPWSFTTSTTARADRRAAGVREAERSAAELSGVPPVRDGFRWRRTLARPLRRPRRPAT